MGANWSKKGNKFERELEKLEKDIVYYETRQRTAQVNRRKFIAYLVYLFVLVELIIIAWYYIHKKPIPLGDKIKDGLPLVVPPLLGYILRAIITFYYTRRMKSDESRLISTRAKLKAKLDEHKKATQFESTQKLLTKYERLTQDEIPGSPGKPAAGGKKQAAGGPQKRNPASPKASNAPPSPFPSTPNSNVNPNTPTPNVNSTPSGAVRPSAPPQHANQSPFPAQSPQRPPANNNFNNFRPERRSWMDKLVDFVVGGDPEHSIALICKNCKSHNGLIPPSEMQSIQFRCRFCNFFNSSGEATDPLQQEHSLPEPELAPSTPAKPQPSPSPSSSESEPRFLVAIS